VNPVNRKLAPVTSRQATDPSSQHDTEMAAAALGEDPGRWSRCGRDQLGRLVHHLLNYPVDQRAARTAFASEARSRTIQMSQLLGGPRQCRTLQREALP
jgi:hypothetical protein